MGISIYTSAIERAAYEKGVREAINGKVSDADVEQRALDLFPAEINELDRAAQKSELNKEASK